MCLSYLTLIKATIVSLVDCKQPSTVYLVHTMHIIPESLKGETYNRLLTSKIKPEILMHKIINCCHKSHSFY